MSGTIDVGLAKRCSSPLRGMRILPIPADADNQKSTYPWGVRSPDLRSPGVLACLAKVLCCCPGAICAAMMISRSRWIGRPVKPNPVANSQCNLQSPQTGNVDRLGVFAWSAVAGADHYEFFISVWTAVGRTCSRIDIGHFNTKNTRATLSTSRCRPPATLLWSVRAFNATERRPAWSKTGARSTSPGPTISADPPMSPTDRAANTHSSRTRTRCCSIGHRSTVPRSTAHGLRPDPTSRPQRSGSGDDHRRPSIRRRSGSPPVTTTGAVTPIDAQSKPRPGNPSPPTSPGTGRRPAPS